MKCKNCGTVYDNHHNFCPDCGARNIRNRLTPDVLAKQVNEEFLSVDNKLLKTFLSLFTKPEDVIVGYINGTRKKYLNVIQYFAFSLTLAGFQAFLILTFFKEQLEISNEFMTTVQNAPGNENNPFKDLKFDDFMQYQGLVYIATLPISVLSVWLAYYISGDRRLNFTEHCVLNIYYNSQVIILTAIISVVFLFLDINYLLISAFLTLPIFLYLGFILKRVFQDDFWNTFAKWMLTIVIFAVLYIAITIVVAIIPILYKML